MKKLFSLLMLLLLLPSFTVCAHANSIQSRAVIGADLDENQIAAVYQAFGFPRGSAIELKVSNAEERFYLEGLVDSSIIGTRSISCVYIELLPTGSGMNITTSNISWCTPQMYISALTTAGITDARILVAAPVTVSGTAALTGIYKAYEDMTGQRLDSAAKQVGTQELTVTGELAQEIGQLDSSSIVSELKLILNETRGMTDQQLRAQIESIAARYGVNLTNTQYQQLIGLCRSLEKLDGDALHSRVEQLQDTVTKVSQAKDQVVSFWSTLKQIASYGLSVIDWLADLFS